MHNLYQILEVNGDASFEVIKKAYREKALIEHPDKGGDPQKMALLTTAYQTLSDPIQRKQFDQEWEVYHAANDTEFFFAAAGALSTAGIPFSVSFKKQHAQLIHQYQKKPLHENPAQTYLKPFCTDLYTQNECAAEEKLDLFSFINTKASTQTALIIKILTPEKAVMYFLDFLSGNYAPNDILALSQAFAQKIQQLTLLGYPASTELQLYQGIYETLLLSNQITESPEKLLFSLQKINDYARVTADQTMIFIAPLLQSRYFRHLFSQALHHYWLSAEQRLDASFLKNFDVRSKTEQLIEKLKNRLSEHRNENKFDQQQVCLLRYASLLYKLEKDLNKRAEASTEDRAAFYRAKAFHLLDWLPALMGSTDYFVLVNTLLQIGIHFQKAAAQETNPACGMADEKLAIKVYLTAIGIGHQPRQKLNYIPAYTVLNVY